MGNLTGFRCAECRQPFSVGDDIGMSTHHCAVYQGDIIDGNAINPDDIPAGHMPIVYKTGEGEHDFALRCTCKAILPCPIHTLDQLEASCDRAIEADKERNEVERSFNSFSYGDGLAEGQAVFAQGVKEWIAANRP